MEIPDRGAEWHDPRTHGGCFRRNSSRRHGGQLRRGGALFAGIDTHKDTLAVAVIDGVGRWLAGGQLPNTEPGFLELVELLDAHQVTKVGIEGSGKFGRAIAVHLALDWTPGREVSVVEVPTLMTSRERRAQVGRGKTDPVDALAIPRITARRAGAAASAAHRRAGRGPAGAAGLSRRPHGRTHRAGQPGPRRAHRPRSRLPAAASGRDFPHPCPGCPGAAGRGLRDPSGAVQAALGGCWRSTLTPRR